MRKDAVIDLVVRAKSGDEYASGEAHDGADASGFLLGQALQGLGQFRGLLGQGYRKKVHISELLSLPMRGISKNAHRRQTAEFRPSSPFKHLDCPPGSLRLFQDESDYNSSHRATR